MFRYSLPWVWKHNRWKDFERFAAHCRRQEIYDSQVGSPNIAIIQSAKNGQLETARSLFDQMPTRTVVSWNAMISGYSKWGQFGESLTLFSTMHHTSINLNETTFSTILSVCAYTQSLHNGKQVHCLGLKCGSLGFKLVGSALLYFYSSCLEIGEAKRVFDELCDENELVWSLMLVGYVKCGFLNDALDLFVKMPKQDVVAWTTLISGYAKSGDGCEKALDLFWLMRRNGDVVPNEFTLDCVVRACGRLGGLCQGRIVHGVLIKCGLELDGSIGGALIEFYCNCGAIDDGIRVYGRIVNPCLNASNSLIGGLILMGRIEDAKLIFDGLSEMNPVSCNLMIKGYAMTGQVEDSKRLFEKMPQKTIVSSNIMISAYSRNGEIDKALKLFEETKGERNTVTWNSMMSGYIQNEMHEEALKLYMTMRRLSIDRSRSTFSVLIHACSCLGSLQQGELLHAHLIKIPFESNIYVGTSLVDMYSKCGNIIDAQKAFLRISSPNVAAWTALINGHAHHGLGSEAILLFKNMLQQKVIPNAATFVGILSACSRAGLVDEGMEIFRSMDKCCGVIPTLEHYACVVDLLGRAGRLLEAEEVIKLMPIEPDGVVWGALLSGCWFWMDMEVGQRVAERIFSFNPIPVFAYVILSNMYAVLGKWAQKMDVRKRLRDLQVKKDPGHSWIELNSKLHVFSVEDRTHPHWTVIYANLDHLTANLNSVHSNSALTPTQEHDYFDGT